VIKNIIIDTDPGVDDAAALLLALASPELKVRAITTVYGNGNIENTTQNALTILNIANRRDIPVYPGVNKPLIRRVRYGTRVHGINAFGGVVYDPPSISPQPTHAALGIIKHVKESPDPVSIVALGPQTNVALALSLDHSIREKVKEIVVMGGAIFTYGNASAVASANFWYDPEAANIVYRSGAKIVQVGLDVCRKVVFSKWDFEKLQKANLPVTNMLTKITPFLASCYQEYSKDYGVDDFVSYNDVPAISYLVNSDLFEIRDYFVQISTHDEITRGQTVADIAGHLDQPANVKVLFNVDAVSLKDLFIDRLINFPTGQETIL